MEYDLPLNVFSFGCVVCHVISQKWPIRKSKRSISGNSNPGFVERYIDMISDNSLIRLVESCLQHDSKFRPHMSWIVEMITNIITSELFVLCFTTTVHGVNVITIEYFNDENIKTAYSLAMKEGLISQEIFSCY